MVPKKIILGSTSPRRFAILNSFNIPFTQSSPDFDELSVPFDGCGGKFALQIALGKAESLAKIYPNDTILTADTVVIYNNQSFGKPVDKQEAKYFLQTLSGNTHSVFTGVILYHQGKFIEGVEETKVHFSKLKNEEIDAYLEAINWQDKAAGYTAELPGSILIDKIDGCYYNVVGLPIHTVMNLFASVGIDLWLYLKKGSKH